MAERFENLDNILRDWAKENIQKSLVGALNMYEKQKKEKTVSFLENDSIKILEQSQSAVERVYKLDTKLVSKLTKPLLCLEYNKPEKQNVYDIYLFKNSQSIVQTVWCLEWNIETNLAFWREFSSPFQGTATNKIYNSLQFTANCIAAIRCLRQFYQSDLRISNHRGHKFQRR